MCSTDLQANHCGTSMKYNYVMPIFWTQFIIAGVWIWKSDLCADCIWCCNVRSESTCMSSTRVRSPKRMKILLCQTSFHNAHAQSSDCFTEKNLFCKSNIIVNIHFLIVIEIFWNESRLKSCIISAIMYFNHTYVN